MLELKYLPVRGLHVGKVPLAVLCSVANFLALHRKEVFPLAVPFGLRFPVVVKISRRVVPVRHSDSAASRFHGHFANRACGGKIGLGLSPFPFNYRISHDQLSSLPQAPHRWLPTDSCWLIDSDGRQFQSRLFIRRGTRSDQAFVLLLAIGGEIISEDSPLNVNASAAGRRDMRSRAKYGCMSS